MFFCSTIHLAGSTNGLKLDSTGLEEGRYFFALSWREDTTTAHILHRHPLHALACILRQARSHRSFQFTTTCRRTECQSIYSFTTGVPDKTIYSSIRQSIETTATAIRGSLTTTSFIRFSARHLHFLSSAYYERDSTRRRSKMPFLVQNLFSFQATIHLRND